MDLFKIIQKSRAEKKLKKITIDSYVRHIKLLNHNKEYENLDFLKHTEEIMNKIIMKKPTSIRNYITSVVVALDSVDKEKYKESIDKYQIILKDLSKEINNNYGKKLKTDKESKNWLTFEELQEIQKKYKLEIDELNLNKKETITPKNNKKLLYYLISSLYTLHAPLRLNWSDMEYVTDKKDIKNDDTKNYMYSQGKFTKIVYLNDYKTIKLYGKQTFKINKELANIITLYKKFNTEKYLLYNTRGLKMSSNSLSKLLPLVFQKDGKHVNLNMIRKIKIASIIDPKQVQKEKALAKEMLHSEETQKGVYMKD